MSNFARQTLTVLNHSIFLAVVHLGTCHNDNNIFVEIPQWVGEVKERKGGEVISIGAMTALY